MLQKRFSKEQTKEIPHAPGVYQFLDKEETILYVGKAKDLKKRVSSYFTGVKKHNRKTLRLVHEIKWIQFVLVQSEFDALLLENNMIKKEQPKYNVLLKDSKSFPSICITNERFPRIFSSREMDQTKGKYYGRYASVRTMRSILEMIKIFKPRTCSYVLSKENIAKKKFKVCLEYHLGNCLGPCEGLQTEKNYMAEIDNARNILKGNLHLAKAFYKDKMLQASNSMSFEQAHIAKEKVALLEKYQAKTVIVDSSISDTDIITGIFYNDVAYTNFMQIKNGAIILSETIELKRKMDEKEEEIIQIALFYMRQKHKSNNHTVFTNFMIESWDDIAIVIPKIGDKKKLVELSLKNAMFYKKEKRTTTPPAPAPALTILQEDLKMDRLPNHIECFDNSNLQGSNPVAAMVCFKNGKPFKSGYRTFNIKTVIGADDFASMKEVVYRRYKRVKALGESFPDLVVVDGGKGQLNAAVEALRELDVLHKTFIIGIAKRLEEIFVPNNPHPLFLSKKSPALKLIQRIRNATHNTAITFHRNKRSKQSLHSSLDDIKGIGVTTKEKILKKYKSVKELKEQFKFEELSSLIGSSKAKIIQQYLD